MKYRLDKPAGRFQSVCQSTMMERTQKIDALRQTN